MANKTFNFLKTRFTPLFQMSVVALVFFALLRTALFIRTWEITGQTPFECLYIYGMGIIYDIAFLSYFCIPFVLLFLFLPEKWFGSSLFKALVQMIGFCILYGLCFSVVAEWFFWDEFGVRFNFISVDYLIYRREVTNNIMETYPVFRILPILFIITVLIFFILRPYFLKAMQIREKFSQRIAVALCLLMIPGLSTLFLNQSQRSFSSNNYVNELASNGPYQLFAAFRSNSLDYRQFYKTGDDQILSDILKEQVFEQKAKDYQAGLYNIKRSIEENEPEKKLNVILISVESLSARFLTRFGEKGNLSPFMDDWFKKGKLFTDFYATGTRTDRGLEAITLSLPPTPGRSTVKRPDNSHMYSLGKVFKEKGYDTVFLYGGRGYFDNMNTFFSGNGYRIVDQASLSDKEVTFKNAWGVCDEDIYNRAVYEAGKAYDSKTPFFFHIMTTSNHQPFTFPEGKIDLLPGEGGAGSGRTGGIKYTDYALSQLIKTAGEKPWFDDTVFVVVADHCAESAGKIGLPVEKYHIPLFIYAPKHIEPEEINLLSSQIDIAPTLLSLLHFSYDSFFFGKNILAPDFKERAFIANYQKLGILTGNKELLILSPGKELSLMDVRTSEPSIKKIDISHPFVNELMSYYQGTDYILKNRLNRWSGNNRTGLVQN